MLSSMKTPFAKSKSATPPKRPVFPIEAQLDELRSRARKLSDEIGGDDVAALPAIEPEDEIPSLDQEAYRLLQGAVKAPLETQRKSSTLRAKRHELAVVKRAIEIGAQQLGDLKVAWAAGELSTRHAEYRGMLKEIALALAKAQKVEGARQEFIQAFASAGAWQSLLYGRRGLKAALGGNSAGPLHEFLTAMTAAGIITRKEIEDV
ncbi:hypothetical protein CV770_03965 [Bradyrhizobium sp. AC87j1]|uniref:hypothetical protein n=1 Tax=Bradyrhizobium sp. AC87j1 TaxID=2055894 RepID=UPI000CECCB6B|nr:hypothetical protein [Bradyrhizobium sp. AC87j1]PPQ20540.1 hypothetical protein CV770_03965 [Bradyrhizobium sp. AC87j1]